jgi:uncharacterized membrane protein
MTAVAHPSLPTAARRGRPWLQQVFLWLGVAILAPAAVALLATPALGRRLPWQFSMPMVAPHVIVALAMLGLGVAQLALPKGDRRHRRLGYAWCVLFAAVSISGLYVQLEPGHVTLIHRISSGFSFANLLLLPVIVWSARARRRKLHRVSVLLAFWFMLQPGLLAYLPFRAIGALVFGLFH